MRQESSFISDMLFSIFSTLSLTEYNTVKTLLNSLLKISVIPELQSSIIFFISPCDTGLLAVLLVLAGVVDGIFYTKIRAQRKKREKKEKNTGCVYART